MYIHRDIEEQVDPFIKKKEVIAVVGPRQSGKTTFLQHLQEKIQIVARLRPFKRAYFSSSRSFEVPREKRAWFRA